MALKIYLEEMVQEYSGIRPVARLLRINPGLIHYVINGGDSPTLRKKFGILKHPRRTRFTANVSPELIARYDTMRGDIPRAEFLDALLDFWQGKAELRY